MRENRVSKHTPLSVFKLLSTQKKLLALGAKNILIINDGSDKVHYSLFDDFASTFMLIRSYDTENRITRLFKQGKRD